MNILLWILQILLALHTAIGAIWKFSNPAQSLPSLSAIPAGGWLALSIIELACVAGLVVPLLYRPLAVLAPIAALVIAAEMVLFCALHLASGDPAHGQLIYWLVVAALCAFIAYGRLVLNPL
ncbi:DoxX family protein [Mesorhizobium marinum]|uniref:DoxX family protein n=1 Tax=Mesorhizobium marinum TaxID=3228790 RepID=A0ABV3QTZ7_9HYPH